MTNSTVVPENTEPKDDTGRHGEQIDTSPLARQKVTLSLRLTYADMMRIKVLADKEYRSVNSMATKILTDYLAGWHKDLPLHRLDNLSATDSKAKQKKQPKQGEQHAPI